MTLFCLAPLLLLAPGDPAIVARAEGAAHASVRAGEIASPGPRALRSAIRAALRETAKAPDAAESARRLVPLYAELQQDTRMAESDRKHYLAILRGRLTKLQAKIESDSRDSLENPPGSEPALASASIAAHARGGGPVRDNGRELVELIQRTIAPDTWDVNGGLGSIIYYQPLRVLVVRQTAENHGIVGGVVGGLRGR